MLPIICKIGPLTIHSYGLMLAISVLVCTFLLTKDARPYGITSEVVFDLVFWVVLAGIIGARIFYIFLNLNFFLQYPLEMMMVQNGGLAWQGGLILGSMVGVWYTKKNKLSLKNTLDLVAPYIALGESIGRIGCFLNGCCFGKEVSWGIYFPVHHARLHPTQLYTMAGLLSIFFILKKYQKISKIKGDVFVLYLFLASILRFLIEFVRADHYVTFLGLSIYQFFCIGFIITSIFLHKKLKGN